MGLRQLEGSLRGELIEEMGRLDLEGDTLGQSLSRHFLAEFLGVVNADFIVHQGVEVPGFPVLGVNFCGILTVLEDLLVILLIQHLLVDFLAIIEPLSQFQVALRPEGVFQIVLLIKQPLKL